MSAQCHACFRRKIHGNKFPAHKFWEGRGRDHRGIVRGKRARRKVTLHWQSTVYLVLARLSALWEPSPAEEKQEVGTVLMPPPVWSRIQKEEYPLSATTHSRGVLGWLLSCSVCGKQVTLNQILTILEFHLFELQPESHCRSEAPVRAAWLNGTDQTRGKLWRRTHNNGAADRNRVLSAILGYVAGEFTVLPMHNADYSRIKLDDLPEEVQKQFLFFPLTVNVLAAAAHGIVAEVAPSQQSPVHGGARTAAYHQLIGKRISVGLGIVTLATVFERFLDDRVQNGQRLARGVARGFLGF